MFQTAQDTLQKMHRLSSALTQTLPYQRELTTAVSQVKHQVVESSRKVGDHFPKQLMVKPHHFARATHLIALM